VRERAGEVNMGMPIEVNRRRAHRAGAALRDYQDDPESAVIDLLADLMHYCDQDDPGHPTFERALELARMHHEAETDGEE
jgi:hypothetical protein